ncbi:MAG: hypothetical protein JWR83_3192 [Aeromicrobium sp.]|nr:hypothetical protein [Aeromicrobium sp.]
MSHDHPHEHGHDHPHEHSHATGVKGFILSIFRPHSHDAADSIDSALESSAEGIRALKISLIVLLGTAVLQLLVVLLTGSVALLADTIHNFSDALTAIPLWIAFVLARRPPTKRFTYGLGRVEDLAGLFIIVMIALSSVVAGYESIRRLINPQDIGNIWVVFAAGIVGFLGNELVASYRIRVGTKIGSAALVADGLHARTDGFTSLAVAVGAVGVALGFPLADPIVGLLISLTILVVLKGAATEVFRRLLDGVDPVMVDQAEEALAATPGVSGIDSLRMRWIGHQLHAEISLTVDPSLDRLAAQKVAHLAEHNVRHRVPKLREANVHVVPDDGESDSITSPAYWVVS